MNNKLIPPDAAADQAENAEPEIETYRPDYCSGNDPYVVILDPPPTAVFVNVRGDIVICQPDEGLMVDGSAGFCAARKPTLTDREARTSRRSSCGTS